MKPAFLALSAILVSSTISVAHDLEAGKRVVEEVCAACHGEDGNTDISIYPKLAGQHFEYTSNQAKAIRDGGRAWGSAADMLALVEGMSDEDIDNAAAFYAKQVALNGEAEQQNIKEGQLIYRGGIASQKVPACMACHVPNGAGIPAASKAKDGVVAYPRISGQNKDYLVSQMQAFRDGSRSHGMMSNIATRLTDQQIDDVANYIQGLR